MPRITINEKVLTSDVRDVAANSIVYVAGKKGNGATASEGVPTLCKTVKAFTDSFGTAPVEGDIGWIMAYNLIKAGMYVLFESFASFGSTTSFEHLKNKQFYDFKFILATPNETDASITWKDSLIGIAKSRGDSIALIDPTKLNGSDAWTASALRTAFFGSTESAWTDGKFAAAFAPWCKCKVWGNSSDADLSEKDLPGSFVYLCAYARAMQSYETWFAAAGSFRGIPVYECNPLVKWTDSDIDTLQGIVISQGTIDNKHPAINPINEVKPFGNIVWGNRTAHGNANGLEAVSFLNIRSLVCELVVALYNASRKYTFEQNTDILWVNFKSQITPLLDRMQSGEGIRGYKIIKGVSADKAKLTATIRIVPIEAVEDFDLTIELGDSLEINA